MENTKSLFLLVAIITAGCSRGDNLSRSDVKKLIDKSEQFQTNHKQFNVSRQELDCGERGGLLVSDYNPNFGMVTFHLTPKGRSEFLSVAFHDDMTAKHNGLGELELKPNLKRHVVEITGMRDVSDKQKYAEFTWSFDETDWSDSAKSCFVDTTSKIKGTANLALYDDGWRVDKAG
jgi:hypothetical protein